MAKRLTAISIAQIRPRATRFEVPDGGCTGLYLSVQPSGKKRFVVRYRLNRKPAKYTLAAGFGLAAARVAAAEVLHKVSQGMDPAAARKDARAAAEIAAGNTLRAVAELYLKREEAKPVERRLRTIAQRRDTFQRLIYPKLGARPISEIKRTEIVKLLDDVHDERGGRMADEVLGCLRIVFDWHARRDDEFRSPIVRGMAITKPKDRMRSRVLTDEELRCLWHAASKMGLPFGLYMQFLLLTAARRNEAARMTWNEVSNGDWLIPASRYKNKYDHLIPLSRAAQTVLANVPGVAECPYVFSGDGQRALGNFSRFKKRLDEKAGVSGYRLHDLRRTSRTLMSAAGVNPDVAERCLGHALPGIRKAYDHHRFRDEKVAAFERLATHIDNIVNPPEDNVVTFRKGAPA